MPESNDGLFEKKSYSVLRPCLLTVLLNFSDNVPDPSILPGLLIGFLAGFFGSILGRWIAGLIRPGC